MDTQTPLQPPMPKRRSLYDRWRDWEAPPMTAGGHVLAIAGLITILASLAATEDISQAASRSCTAQAALIVGGLIFCTGFLCRMRRRP